MAPHRTDDLPRREDGTRQLMLGSLTICLRKAEAPAT